MTKHNSAGFSAVVVLAAIVVIGLIGTAGWFVYSKNTTITKSDRSTGDNFKVPGAESSALDAGRMALVDKLARVKDAISATPLKPTYSSEPFQWTDYCYHRNNPKPSPTDDGIVNKCYLDTKQYFAYSESRCEVINALRANSNIDFNDNIAEQSCQNKPYSPFFLKSNQEDHTVIPINIFDKQDFLDYINQNAKIFLPTYDGCAAQETKMRITVSDAKLYCINRSKPIAVDQIPNNTQTIIEIGILEGQYFKK